MSQKYKVYFANRPVLFGGRDEGPGALRCKVINSQGKADTMLIESAFASGARQVSLCCSDVEGAWQSFCDQFELVQAAGGVVLNGDGHILFIFRHGKWDLPKGKVEEDEEIRAGAVREVEEECAISGPEVIVPLITTWHTYMQAGVPTLKSTEWYLMRYTGNDVPHPQVEEGITEARWFHPDQIAEVKANTYPSVLDVIEGYFQYRGQASPSEVTG
jgi:8-oxo-dGTP pyrophosphatase MutT (NUDIX family)